MEHIDVSEAEEMDLLEFASTEAEFRSRFADETLCREYLARLETRPGRISHE